MRGCGRQRERERCRRVRLVRGERDRRDVRCAGSDHGVQRLVNGVGILVHRNLRRIHRRILLAPGEQQHPVAQDGQEPDYLVHRFPVDIEENKDQHQGQEMLCAAAPAERVNIPEHPGKTQYGKGDQVDPGAFMPRDPGTAEGSGREQERHPLPEMVDQRIQAEAYEGINLDAANVNDDDEVSISDAIVLINYVLNSNSKKRVDEIHSAIVDRYDATSDELVIPSVSLRPGETRTINVSLNNTERSYSAMQCELILPQGVTLTAVEGIDRGNGHDFYMQRHEAEQNVYTLMGLSMNMANFNSDEGNVLRLTVTAGEDFNPDNAEVELANVQLVTAKSNIYLAGSSVTRLNDVTAVEHVTVANEVIAVRYINVAGQESDTPFAGVNIMVTTYTDGTTSTMKVIK